MKLRSAPFVVAALLFAAACSGSGDVGPASSNPVGSVVGAPTTLEIDDTAPDPITPSSASVAVPAGVNWVPSKRTPPDTAAVTPTFEQISATAGVPPAPAGFPFRQSDYIRKLFDFGDVQLATGSCNCWQGGNSSGVTGDLRSPIYLFRSGDAGATWAQVDLLAALGEVNGQIERIVQSEGGFTLVATTSPGRSTTPVIAIAGSPDGAVWSALSTISGDAGAAVRAFDIYTMNSSLVVYGADLACEFDGGSAIQSIGPAYQDRFWTSTDGGASWAAQSPDETGLATDRPSLPDAATCASLDVQGVIDKYSNRPRLVQFIDDRVLVWNSDGTQIVTTTDGTTWAASTLDGAIALPSDQIAEPVATSEASAILSIDGQYTAMNLEDFRYIDDTSSGSTVGLSVVTWTSADGMTWTRQPIGRPILNADFLPNYAFFTQDDRAALIGSDNSNPPVVRVFESAAGDAEDWSTCPAVAGADCSFASELTEFATGADLSGIDLSFASLDGRDLTDVSFVGATLSGTSMVEVTIERTNFDNANLSDVDLFGALSTSTFAGATLSRVTFSDEFFKLELGGATIASPRILISDAGLPTGVSMVGRDLTAYELSNGTLAGVDFSGANVIGGSFYYTDLTGANFSGANLDGVFFFEVTCPDGQPNSEGSSGGAACRL